MEILKEIFWFGVEILKEIFWFGVGVGGLVLCIVLCCGVFSPQPYDEATAHVEIVENITRVFMHDTNTYSFYVENGRKLDHVRVRHSMSDGTKVSLIQDVPKDKKMWAVIKNSGHRWTNLEIHLHSSKSVEGGQWESGHGGGRTSGRVVPVE